MDLGVVAVAALPAFIASAVEFVEATTIVLAVGVTRGWRAPLLGSLAPFLGELNPILQWLELYQTTIGDFLGNAANATAAKVASVGGTGHYLRQIGPSGAETLGIHTTRLGTNRGNGYLGPTALAEPDAIRKLIFPNWDCKPSRGEVAAVTSSLPVGAAPACFVATPVPFQGRNTALPHVQAETYP